MDSDKLKKRQEKLAAWKQKKLQQPKDSPAASTDSSDEKQARQKRIEEWKRKRLSGKPEAPEKPVESKKPLLKINKIQKKDSRPHKRSAFGIELDESAKPTFKKPTLQPDSAIPSNASATTSIEDEIDLEEFIASYEKEESQVSEKTVDFEPSDDEQEFSDSESETLSNRLKKLQEREKALESIDHSSIDYKPFEKNFYKPPKELENLSQSKIEEIRHQLSEIKIRGNNCPVPITRWSQLGLSLGILEIFKSLNYNKPSPIQAQALPAIMSGRDIIGVAKTGSGKTLSFVLPMVRHVQAQAPVAAGEGPIGLILTPTRELALQIHKEIGHFKAISSCCCYGGSNIEPQIAELKKGVQVIVGTPGRVIDLLTVNSGRVTNLQRVTYLVMDEADRMYDMGFEPQVNKILSQIRPDRQTVLFSATFPKKLEKLAKSSLNDPVEIVVGGINVVAKEIDQKIEFFDVDGMDADEVNRQKFLRLVKILDDFFLTENSKLLIFVEKQDLADLLMVQLTSSDYNCTSIHGGKDQLDRKHAIKEFSAPDSNLNILIATSVAARGLDVKGLDLVVNYDAPSHLEDYIHRVGRTGRAGKKGTAITFVTSKQERAIADLVKVVTPPVDVQLVEIANKFLSKVKSGKEKYSFGFGGKGLEKLQQQRESTKDIERQTYEEATGTTTTIQTPPATDVLKEEPGMPDFDIVEGIPADSSGPDRSKFHSRITINDLPQKVRWLVSNRDNISKIIESTSTSVTHKGQYYAAHIKPKKDQPPKLYLLVEGLTHSSVAQANELIKSKIIEGLQAETSTKYTV